MHFFRVPWIMDGPWYQTWLTSFVLLVLFFGTACGTAWSTGAGACPGWLAFIAAQVLVALGAVVVVSLTHHWAAVGQFFTTITAPALTGVLAAVAVTLGLGGLTTIRRVTI